VTVLVVFLVVWFHTKVLGGYCTDPENGSFENLMIFLLTVIVLAYSYLIMNNVLGGLKNESYFRPWVIRTNPQHRGFDYVSGVKRQAGQEEILVTSTSGRNNPMEIPSGCYDSTDRRSLDNLEMAEVVRNGTKQALTEIEELEQIRQRNDVSASVNDADANASIRKSFRSDRKEKRRRLGEAKEKGWRDGMMVLPTNDHDVLAANDNCYGRPAEAEKRKLSAVRKSSIFSSNRARGNKNGRKRPRSSDRRADDTTTKVSCASPVRSGNFFVSPRNHTKRTEIAAASELTTNPVVDEVGSSSSLATVGIRPNTAKKKTLQLRRGENGLTILGKEKIIALKKSSFSQMMAAYGSDEDS